jgi:hypothetical protein
LVSLWRWPGDNLTASTTDTRRVGPPSREVQIDACHFYPSLTVVLYPRRGACTVFPIQVHTRSQLHPSTCRSCLGLRVWVLRSMIATHRRTLCGCCISDRGPSRRVADGVEEMAARLYWAVEQQWIRNARTNTDKPNKSKVQPN